MTILVPEGEPGRVLLCVPTKLLLLPQRFVSSKIKTTSYKCINMRYVELV